MSNKNGARLHIPERVCSLVIRRNCTTNLLRGIVYVLHQWKLPNYILSYTYEGRTNPRRREDSCRRRVCQTINLPLPGMFHKYSPISVPVAKMKSMEVTNPSPKTWNPRRYSYTGLKKLSKNSRIHHVAYTVTTTGKSIALQTVGIQHYYVLQDSIREGFGVLKQGNWKMETSSRRYVLLSIWDEK